MCTNCTFFFAYRRACPERECGALQAIRPLPVQPALLLARTLRSNVQLAVSVDTFRYNRLVLCAKVRYVGTGFPPKKRSFRIFYPKIPIYRYEKGDLFEIIFVQLTTPSF